MNQQDFKNRTKQFALILECADMSALSKAVRQLPDRRTPKRVEPEGRAIASQLVRSGTSVVANYRAACRGRSKAEFIAKVGVAEEEADETALWLELIIEDKLLPEKKVRSLLDEANELTAIMAASYISASRSGRDGSAKSAIKDQKSAIRL